MKSARNAFIAMVASAPLLGACSQTHDAGQALHQQSVDRYYTFEPPQNLLEDSVDTFLKLDEMDRESYVLQGDTTLDVNESDPDVIEDYFRGKGTFSHSEKQVVREAMQNIGNTPDGFALIQQAYNSNGGPISMINNAEGATLAIGAENSHGDIERVITIGGSEQGATYQCNNDVGQPSNDLSFIRILYHELYHMAHHLDEVSVRSSTDSFASIELEEETVQATDRFMAAHFGECPRVAYSNMTIPFRLDL